MASGRRGQGVPHVFPKPGSSGTLRSGPGWPWGTGRAVARSQPANPRRRPSAPQREPRVGADRWVSVPEPLPAPGGRPVCAPATWSDLTTQLCGSGPETGPDSVGQGGHRTLAPQPLVLKLSVAGRQPVFSLSTDPPSPTPHCSPYGSAESANSWRGCKETGALGPGQRFSASPASDGVDRGRGESRQGLKAP